MTDAQRAILKEIEDLLDKRHKYLWGTYLIVSEFTDGSGNVIYGGYDNCNDRIDVFGEDFQSYDELDEIIARLADKYLNKEN